MALLLSKGTVAKGTVARRVKQACQYKVVVAKRAKADRHRTHCEPCSIAAAAASSSAPTLMAWVASANTDSRGIAPTVSSAASPQQQPRALLQNQWRGSHQAGSLHRCPLGTLW
eukprot:1146132-Pelagomonas_calceolata.AAC.5